jgi:hypothetical protein
LFFGCAVGAKSRSETYILNDSALEGNWECTDDVMPSILLELARRGPIEEDATPGACLAPKSKDALGSFSKSRDAGDVKRQEAKK